MPSVSLLIKPVSGSCNLHCRYCFYADEQENRAVASCGRMSRETMHLIVDRALAYADGSCTFAFQGGEPTLAGLDFFRDLTAYAAAHPNPKHLHMQFALQTNGMTLNAEWAEFLAKNHYLVGVSLDGLKEIHDRNRVDAQGKGTYGRVMESVRLLEKYHVDYNILVVVTAAAARNAQKIYRFFQKNRMEYQQYIECLDPIGEVPGGREYSLTPERYESFLKNLFDAWYLDRKAGKHVYNRYFENLLLMLSGRQPESCNMRGVCGKQWVMEADGSVYPCDFYALDEWKLGNIGTDSFEAMDQRRGELGFLERSFYVPEVCQSCRWFALCRNGCYRNREQAGKNAGVNYFCTAYRGFFEYAYPRLVEIYRLTVSGRI